jgi:acyl-CoA synthetase (AMP-forming)/AMP-acid ligase II
MTRIIHSERDSIHLIFQEVAACHPTKPAVCCAGFSSSAVARLNELPHPFDDGADSPLSLEFFTFQELFAMSTAVAVALNLCTPSDTVSYVGSSPGPTEAASCHEQGQPAPGELSEEVVLVLMDEGVGVVAAELGILQAGCAFAPVDPTWPAARIRFIARDCRARRAIALRSPLLLLRVCFCLCLCFRCCCFLLAGRERCYSSCAARRRRRVRNKPVASLSK